jgi:DNA repair protein RecO (recombination protein O)
MCALLDGALPEREAQPGLFEGSAALLDVIVLDDDNAGWVEGYVRWELGLLAAVGYRLDLARCVASGQTSDLAFVSPKSGGAVGRHKAGSFASRMLALPTFLGGVSCGKHDCVAGLDLTGHFLSKRVFAAHNLDLPTQRKRLADMVDSRYNGK